MKGTPQFVMCGNSHRALEALRRAGAPVTAVDILPDPRIREELSALSGWPTIPQVFVGGELVGGADIVEELEASGELERTLAREARAGLPRRGRRARRGRRLKPRDYNRIVDFETRAIHDGQEPDPATGAITVPIYQTSTFVQEAVGEHKGYDYARVPTRRGRRSSSASPRSRAPSTASPSPPASARRRRSCTCSSPGDRVVAVADVYGGVYRMFSQVYEPKGYEFECVPGGRDEREPRRAPRRAHAHRLARDADEPAAEHRRHPRGGRRGARGRRARRRRQHVRLAVPAAAARARRGRRRALDDEVPRRPLRRDRRLRRHERPDDRRAPHVPAEVARRVPGPVRLRGSCCAD